MAKKKISYKSQDERVQNKLVTEDFDEEPMEDEDDDDKDL
jgi:hypothetical protein